MSEEIDDIIAVTDWVVSMTGSESVHLGVGHDRTLIAALAGAVERLALVVKGLGGEDA